MTPNKSRTPRMVPLLHLKLQFRQSSDCILYQVGPVDRILEVAKFQSTMIGRDINISHEL